MTRNTTDDAGALTARLTDLLSGPVEPLEEEMTACIVDGPLGQAIRHPLVIAPVYGPQLNALYNEQLRTKREAVNITLVDGDVAHAVWLHERPWRAEVLATRVHLLDDAAYWDLLGRVWTDSENIVEMNDLCDTLLRSERSQREAMMSDVERAALAALPDTVEIFQGHTDRRDDGWSWTTDSASPIWQPYRNPPPGPTLDI